MLCPLECSLVRIRCKSVGMGRFCIWIPLIWIRCGCVSSFSCGDCGCGCDCDWFVGVEGVIFDEEQNFLLLLVCVLCLLLLCSVFGGKVRLVCGKVSLCGVYMSFFLMV